MLNIQMKKMKEELEEKARKLEERREKELARAREEARAIVKEAREVSREVQEELKTLSRLESMGERTAGFDRNRRRLKELERKNRETIKREVSREPVDPDKPVTGRPGEDIDVEPERRGDIPPRREGQSAGAGGDDENRRQFIGYHADRQWKAKEKEKSFRIWKIVQK